MAITFQPSSYSGLVDQDNGMVSREIFVNPDIYAEEQDRIFTRAWLFVGHESQVAKPGDFFVSSMGEESVILCRDREGEIHVFLNSCMHRGMKVCRYDEGNTPIFTCPYHGWSFATDGALVGVPFYKDAYHEELDKSQWGLIRVPRMVNYKGGIWATWDANAPDFLEYIGGFRTYLDILFDGWDGTEGGTEIIGGIEKWMVPSNWKFPAENFIGDRYHNISHRSVDLVGIGPSGQGRRDNSEREGAKSLDVSFPERGHGTVMFLRPEDAQPMPSYQNDPVVVRVLLPVRDRAQGAAGSAVAHPGRAGNYLPQHVLPAPPAAQHRRVASARPGPDRGLAVVPGGRLRAAGGQGVPAPVLHPLLRSRRPDRAGRHGELELRPRRQPGRHGPPAPLQLPDGHGLRRHRFRGRRPEARRHRARHHQGPGRRAEPAGLLQPLA